MAEKTTPFVVNDRRKFTPEGELRPGVELSKPEPEAEDKATQEPIAFPSSNLEPERFEDEPEKQSSSEPITFPSTAHEAATDEPEAESDENIPPAPTAEQSAQAARAYEATVERLDTAIRATNPGMERVPEMSFDRFVQSLYMQAILQLGGGAEPGQTPQVDIIGARQTIDMLAIFEDKTKGNLSKAEDNLVQSALFEARMGFLEVTQALARQSAGRAPGGMPGAPGGGPSIVR